MSPSFFLKIIKSFSRRELVVFTASFFLFLISLSFLAIDFIESNTKIIPIASGKYIEGAVGQPSFINPLIAASRFSAMILFFPLKPFKIQTLIRRFFKVGEELKQEESANAKLNSSF